MTDKEIVKALECCIKAKTNADCEALKCPFYDNEIDICMYVNNEEVIYANALDLINRQQAEIERLSNSAKQWEDTAKDLFISKEKQQAEIERLNNDLRIWKDIAHRETAYVETAKLETIKNYLETCEKTATSNAAKAAKAKFLEMVGEDR